MKMSQKRFFLNPGNRLWQAAASLVLICAVSFYIFQKQADKPSSAEELSSNINPATDQATLTLGNGEKILLDNSKNGELSAEGNIHINKLKPGNLVYTASKKRLARCIPIYFLPHGVADTS
ncbi:hypothetical protein KUH03_01235 [Sphingobacterium sp. E70]|uniref:hypothetical protein n=1 Tax=Sphingobacterium sp. E70 TaxID=2853439 RepID=UPI00211B8D7F|nr:hypothetical protein [Sphingobacterium sp. E70]ULT25663.1 hypothetical protein KUH03_01235 [Sphingobacterium sp. E70]